MTAADSVIVSYTPKRNWGGVVIAVAGAFELASTLFNAIARSFPDFPTSVFGTIFGLQLASFLLVPPALAVGFAPLAFGARGLASIAGPGSRARLFVFAATLVGCLAQFGILVLLISEIGPDEETIARASSAILVIEIFALLVALVAGIVIARARVVAGFARWSLIVGIALIAVTLVLGYSNIAQNWQDVPRAVGLLAIGLSYWRAGLRSTVSNAARVTEESKSLAE
jgi:hypothetical protein